MAFPSPHRARAGLLIGALALAASFHANAEPVHAPREMDEAAILNIVNAWKNRVFVVVADAGPCRAPVHRVLTDPKALYRKRRVGCAVYVGEGRLLLTTASVVKGPPGARPEAEYVEVFDDSGHHVLARIVGRDRFLDVALLEATEVLPGTEGLPDLEFADEPYPGTGCLVLGAAFGRSLSATLGTMGPSVDIIPNGLPVRAYHVRAPIYPGDSGGPVLDAKGRFVGIVMAGAMPGHHPVLEGLVGTVESRELRIEKPAAEAGYAVPARAAQWAWEDLRRFGRVRRAFLGVEMSVANEGEGGARILNVVPDSPAERIGIRAGDVVTSFGGQVVSTPRELIAIVAAMSPNRQLDIELLRENVEHRLSVQLVERDTPPKIRHVAAPVPVGDGSPDSSPIAPVRGDR